MWRDATSLILSAIEQSDKRFGSYGNMYVGELLDLTYSALKI